MTHQKDKKAVHHEISILGAEKRHMQKRTNGVLLTDTKKNQNFQYTNTSAADKIKL